MVEWISTLTASTKVEQDQKCSSLQYMMRAFVVYVCCLHFVSILFTLGLVGSTLLLFKTDLHLYTLMAAFYCCY